MLEKMVEEHRPVEVAVVPKFNMPHHKSKMSSKDVKSSAKKYNIPLDLYPCAPSEGWTMDQLPEETIAITMSECLRFPFLFDVSIGKGAAISATNRVEPNTTPLLPIGEPIPEKTNAQLEVEVDDPKVVMDREKKKAQAAKKAIKNKESKKRVNDERDGSKAKTNRRKTPAARENKITSSGHVSSLTPLRTVVSTGRVMIVQSGSDGENERTQDAPKDDHNSNRLSPRELANESVHNYVDIDGGNTKESPPRLEPFVNLSGKPLNADKEEVFLSSQLLAHHIAHHTLSFGGPLLIPREILKGLHAEDGESSRSGEIYVPEWESNALPNPIALKRAWFSLARGAMTQAYILERFENLQDDYTKLAETHADRKVRLRRVVLEEEFLAGFVHAAKGFDAYSDKKLYPMYDKLFEKEYPYVIKIASGYRHSVADLLKIHHDPAPPGSSAASTVSTAFGKPPSTLNKKT
ncbi:hypothetical protein Tco_0514622 [Tanacetum coccineum]